MRSNPIFCCGTSPIFQFLIGMRVPVRGLQTGVADPQFLEIGWRPALPEHRHPRMSERVQTCLRETESRQEWLEHAFSDVACREW